MEHHVKCEPKDVARYVLCPGDQARAKKIADHFENAYLAADNRGIVVYSGTYKGVFMTSCGTGMGGPVVAIALEELAHMGADTFIRVGSCGVFQEGQMPGDVIIASGTFRAGGTSLSYLPLGFPAVPTYEVLRSMTDAADVLKIPYTVGVGMAGDSFYAPREPGSRDIFKTSGVVSVEMESDTLFIVGAYRRWRTGAVFTSDGTPKETKPAWGWDAFYQGEENAILIALDALYQISQRDEKVQFPAP
ncbi:MAG: nucleoside phosphorylase [Chloroflexi bacterium]|nr:nucleoside phosphorylase [Chloroflexota bacterium]